MFEMENGKAGQSDKICQDGSQMVKLLEFIQCNRYDL